MPTPQQLFALSSVAISAAKQQRRFRAGMRYDNAHFLWMRPLELGYGEEDALEQDLRVERKLIGHIRRLSPTTTRPYRSWSLRMRDSLARSRVAQENAAGVDVTYSFEWHEGSTIKALRKVRHLPTADQADFLDEVANARIDSDIANIWDAEMDMLAVNRDDCDLLLREVQNFCAESLLWDFLVIAS
jgi:hypothetical protein